MLKICRAGAAVAALALLAGPAEARTVEFHGRVAAGPTPNCMAVQGYDITAAAPRPQPGACIRGSGTVAADRVGICMTGPILTDVRWQTWDGCK